MMNLYGGTGMGASGMGAGAGPMVSGGAGMNPQLLAMLQAMQQNATPAPGPMQGNPTGTPMANYIGQAGAHPSMPPTMPPPVGQPPGMDQPGGQPVQGVNPQMMQMLQMLRGGQTGVLPTGQNPAAPNLTGDMNTQGMTVPPGAADAVASAGSGGQNAWLASLLAKLRGG